MTLFVSFWIYSKNPIRMRRRGGSVFALFLRCYLLQRCPRAAPGPLTPGPQPPPRASLVCSFAAPYASTSRVLFLNPTGSTGVGNTTTLPAVRALPDNCSCVHSICCRRPVSPPPAWLRTSLRLTLLLVGLLTCQSIRTSSTLTAPKLHLHAWGSARTLDCCALPAATCECWIAEPQLTPHPPVVAKSCSNPRAHKAEVHYQDLG